MSYPDFRSTTGRGLLFLSLLFVSIFSYGNVRLPAVLASNMVLQQRSEVKLWGWGEPNEKVVVTTSWDNRTYPAVTVTGFADWQLAIQTPTAGGPYTIHIDGNNKITLTNVMLSGNSTVFDGGAILNLGHATLAGITVSGNSSTGEVTWAGVEQAAG